MELDETAADRFSTYVDKTDTCWLWTGPQSDDGYGRFYVRAPESKRHRAHRVAFLLENDYLPEAPLILRHSCDEPLCVNPAHLLPGTHADNVADRVEHGVVLRGDDHPARKNPAQQPRGADHWTARHPELRTRGESHGLTTLVADDVRAIRRRHADGESMAVLSREFGVNKTTIFNIVHRKTWGHVD